MKSPPIFILFFIFSISSCDSAEDFSVEEQNKVTKLFEYGLSFEDPYTRAETLRILNLFPAPEHLQSLTQGMEKDTSPMVRLIALRTMMKANSPVSSHVLNAFTKGDAKERRVLLESTFEFGDDATKAELAVRTFRGSDKSLKRIAFKKGMLSQVDQAIAEKKTKLLEGTLLPDLGAFVTKGDPILAPLALRKLVDAGQPERANRLIRILSNFDENLKESKERVLAATILSRAHITKADEIFRTLINRHDAQLAETKLALPNEIVTPEILKWAILGLAAKGDEAAISRANTYRVKANISDSIEVLESFALNPHASAASSLRIAMTDVRSAIRRRAIELYVERKDASPKLLADALNGADQETRVRIFRVLVDRFSEKTIPILDKRLQRTSEVDLTLKLLINVINSKEDAIKILKPLQASLTKLHKDKKETRAQQAKYLVAISSINETAPIALLDSLADDMLYGYLEFALKENAIGNQSIFKHFYYNDLFSIRLISGAGLLAANAKQ